MSSSLSDIIYLIAKNNETLSNQEILNIVYANKDKEMFQALLQSGCVQVEQVTDIERTNARIAAMNAEMAMWNSGNSGALGQARAYQIAHSSVPIVKKMIEHVAPGDLFCQMIMKQFQTQIEAKRKELLEKQRAEAKIQRKEFKRRQAEIEQQQKLERDLKEYGSAKSVEKRNDVKRTAYNEATTLFQKKLNFENALDEIYFIAHAPGDYIPLHHAERAFQRRTQTQKEQFENSHKPKEPHYEVPREESSKLKITHEPIYPLGTDSRYGKNAASQVDVPLKDIRPIQYHEQNLEVFNHIYRLDNTSYLQRLNNALATLNREISLIRNEPYFTSMTISIKGRSLRLSDILLNRNHPHFQFAPLKTELEGRVQSDSQAKQANEMKLRQEIDQRNQQKVEGRQADQANFERLNGIKAAVLAEFAEAQKFVKTHRIIQNHNNAVAIQLFRMLYQAERRSLLGSMHDKVAQNTIYSFSEIEIYGLHNQDYFESKTRKILRQYKAQFEQILFSPLYVRFEMVSKEQLSIEPIATFEDQQEATAYSAWYREQCPKKISSAAFITEFSNLYATHVKERVLPVPFDKMRKWIADNEIFSYKQLTHYAELNPESEVAKILKTTLKNRLEQVTKNDEDVANLTIHSQTYIDPQLVSPRELYDRNENLNRIGVDKIYLFTDRKSESYTPPQMGRGDQIAQLNLHPANVNRAMLQVEDALYQDFMN